MVVNGDTGAFAAGAVAGTNADADSGVGLGGFGRIAADVSEDLAELAGIAINRQRGLAIEEYANAARDCGLLEETDDIGKQGADIDGDRDDVGEVAASARASPPRVASRHS
ncbi:MAG TPA: hypothetical protein VHX13_10565 [Acidobacteriaceae bacterium]|nr:hypothetical protein [Acidobacteriaceae bacterium]